MSIQRTGLGSKIVLIIITCHFASKMFGQHYEPFFPLDHHNDYIDYLVNNDSLVMIHPLYQPYRVTEVLDSLSSSESSFTGHWNRLLKHDLLIFDVRQDSVSQRGQLIIGAQGGSKIYFVENDFYKRSCVSTYISYSFNNLGFFYRFDVDEAYKFDKDYFGGIGKLGKPLSARTGEAYLHWDTKHISLYAGRMAQNYGLINEDGLLLSTNPYSYDQIGFRFYNRLLRISSFFSRLEDVYGYDIRDIDSTSYWNKRYISVHRFELSLSPKLKLAISESVIYGGRNQQFLFQYLNPINIYYFSKLSDRKGYQESDANILASIELLYKPIRKITLFTQFLVDDMDFTKELRKQFPDRIGISSKLVFSDPFQGGHFFLKYNRMSNWTYNSFYNWGNYTFYGKSLGYPKNGVENLTIGLDIFKYVPFIFKIKFKGEHERAQDLKSAFIGEKTSFPIGIPQKSLSTSAEATWFPKTWLNASLKVEYVKFQNFEHIPKEEISFINLYLAFRFIGFIKLLN